MRHLVAELRRPEELYQALDATAIMVRYHHRRGEGRLFGQADISWSNRLGWYVGIWLNRKFQRPNLAFADLVSW